MIRCSIWTPPFNKIGFSQFNTVSAGIVPHCCFFSARTEEMPEVIALDCVLVALNFSWKLCVFAFQIHKERDVAELHRMLTAWGTAAAKLKAGEITKEEYDR